MSSTPLRSIAIIGAGVIGLSWARLARDHGWTVTITDPAPELEEWVTAELGVGDPLVRWTPDLAEAVADADLVQENGPERLAVKQAIFAEVLAHAPADAVLATSSSSIASSLIGEGLEDASRLLVGHPFNPPHLMPLVEVVPGPATAADVVERAVDLYRALDRVPVVVRREMPGHVANRLQNALSREAQYLVEEGVVGVADLDAILQNSLGLRWSAIGLFEGNVLGGGPGGARHLFEHVGAQTGKIELGSPSKDPAVRERLIADIESEYGVGEAAYRSLVARRDRRTTAVLDALADLKEES